MASSAPSVRQAASGCTPSGDEPLPTSDTLVEALVAFDDVAAHGALDRLLSSFTLETVLGDALLPTLRDLGERWLRDEIRTGQEHFASNLIRGRMLGLARGWDRGAGPRALLACPAGEQHDVSLIAFGLALREHGWRITYLGADTPPFVDRTTRDDSRARPHRPDCCRRCPTDPVHRALSARRLPVDLCNLAPASGLTTLEGCTFSSSTRAARSTRAGRLRRSRGRIRRPRTRRPRRIVVIPVELGERVVARAEEKVVGENLVRDKLADGMPISEAFRIYGVI